MAQVKFLIGDIKDVHDYIENDKKEVEEIQKILEGKNVDKRVCLEIDGEGTKEER